MEVNFTNKPFQYLLFRKLPPNNIGNQVTKGFNTDRNQA